MERRERRGYPKPSVLVKPTGKGTRRLVEFCRVEMASPPVSLPCALVAGSRLPHLPGGPFHFFFLKFITFQST